MLPSCVLIKERADETKPNTDEQARVRNAFRRAIHSTLTVGISPGDEQAVQGGETLPVSGP